MALRTAQQLATETSKRFDLLTFHVELALLKGSRLLDNLKKELVAISATLEMQTGVPGIATQRPLIDDIQSDPWWEGVTVPGLEFVRCRLRDLIQHIERERRAIVYSNLADELGEESEATLPQVGELGFVRFKQKTRLPARP